MNRVSTHDTIWGETLTPLKWQANPPCLKTGPEPCPCIWLTTFLWSSCSVSETGIPTHKMGYLFHFRDGFIAWHTESFMLRYHYSSLTNSSLDNAVDLQLSNCHHLYHESMLHWDHTSWLHAIVTYELIKWQRGLGQTQKDTGGEQDLGSFFNVYLSNKSY